jgi:hypothetical protein
MATIAMWDRPASPCTGAPTNADDPAWAHASTMGSTRGPGTYASRTADAVGADLDDGAFPLVLGGCTA